MAKHIEDIKEGRLGVQILQTLASGVVICCVLSSPAGTRRLLSGIKREWHRRSVFKSLDRLQRRKLVAYSQRSDGTFAAVLTDAGRRKLLEYKTGEIEIKKPKHWDYKWRVICSDIPESKKKARDALRRKFVEWGFYPIQKSVFLYPYPCEDEIAIVRDIFDIPVSSLFVVEANHMGNENYFKRYFKLSR